MIRLRGISKSYNRSGVKAVDKLDLEVKGGEIFGFLGPNGAGKTTTIKMMVGLLEPDEGVIEIDGHDIQREPLAAKRSIGFVPDNPMLYEKLTGIEYLNFLGDVYGVPGELRRERISRCLELFGLQEAVNDLIQSYSHGMRQKIVLTGALLHDPPVFILDEPMTGLDPRSSRNLKELMQEHVSRGRTVFFSTHVLEVAERFCHRVCIIHRGRLIACGTMEELKGLAQDTESLENIFLELTEE